MRGAIVLLGMLCVGCTKEEPASGPCVDETRTVELADGLVGDGALAATVLSADPVPAEVGVNRWALDVPDAAGCDVSVTPFMPDHDHGTTEPATIDRFDGTRYDVEMDLIMGGFWTVTVEAACGDEEPVEAVFRICVET